MLHPFEIETVSMSSKTINKSESRFTLFGLKVPSKESFFDAGAEKLG
jgi:hypothetical protein